ASGQIQCLQATSAGARAGRPRPALLSRRHADYFYRAQRDEAARQLPSRQATNVFRVASLEKVSRKQLVQPQLIKPRVHKQAWLYREVLVAGLVVPVIIPIIVVVPIVVPVIIVIPQIVPIIDEIRDDRDVRDG